MSNVDDLLAQALALPEKERAKLMSELLTKSFSRLDIAGRGAGIWGLLTLLESLVDPANLGAFRCKATMAHIERVFSQDAAFLSIYAQQLGQWKNEPLTQHQIAEIERLTQVIGKCRTVVSAILELARELESGTTERALERIEQVLNGTHFDAGIS